MVRAEVWRGAVREGGSMTVSPAGSLGARRAASAGALLLAAGTLFALAAVGGERRVAERDYFARLHAHVLAPRQDAFVGPLDLIVARHAADARAKLVEGLEKPCDTRDCAFDDVAVSLHLKQPQVLAAGDGSGQGRKAMLNPVTLFGALQKRSSCVVYGLGISDDSRYEQDMSKFCETHAFDCTIAKDAPAVNGMPFTFHQTCIGPRSTIKDTSGYGGQTWDLEFKSLKTIMRELGHKAVDVLKFDIEGSEWKLLLKEVIDGGLGDNRPRQIQFELHTKWANPAFVPQDFVRDKGRREVNQLFLALHDLGYRIVSKELNSGDPACAEFALVLSSPSVHLNNAAVNSSPQMS